MGKIPKTIKSLSFLVDQLTDYWSVDLKLHVQRRLMEASHVMSPVKSANGLLTL